jgi:hypothetical protein
MVSDMMALVLQRLEKLQADLALIDPAEQNDAADAVADMAVLVRDMLSEASLGRAPATVRTQPFALQAAG